MQAGLVLFLFKSGEDDIEKNINENFM